MATKWGDSPLSEFQISNIAENEDGYNYYLYIHARGLRIIMREKIDGTEYRYAKMTGGWDNRANLDYIDYDKLA